ncbi:chemotaxis protein CheX [Telmatobacter bradus]|uniref:chemotaxis protein CheX n=1 Tax=Telmatobacter bradus TaxID=474953 RepID=UPI003B4313B0
MSVHIDEESVIKANDQFWEQMLAMRLEHVPSPDLCCVDAGHLLASVQLSGTWTGRIEVRLSDGLAQSATAAMLMQPPESVAEADRLDASKEIANMIAGTIKSCLPRPCAMTVPESRVESERFCEPPRTEYTLIVGFHHADGDLMVRVSEQEPGSETIQ